MSFFVHKSAVSLFSFLLALAGVCSGGSDAPRGVAVGFVFDLKAKCDPPCEHGGVCIRNNTCFCSKGYEGETCQYGEAANSALWFGHVGRTVWFGLPTVFPNVKMVERVFVQENAGACQAMEEDTVTK
ncbi:hypothetical protein ILYODFUR_004592 [Ilyodon furcidens]|uniref:EGF-like domain-containing protein n=1 Tax=Ilyodon furcidens TaxID=33524 RepID=A0ABV0UF39_9TELE